MTIQSLASNWKTTSTGLIMAGGAIVHLIFAVRSHTADENTWTITIGAVVGGVGLLVAGDASASVKKDPATTNTPALPQEPPTTPPTV